MNLVVRPEVAAEVQEIHRWYARQRIELGREFLREFRARVRTILQHPLRFRLVHAHIRRAALRRFPYGIFYIVRNTTIFLVACLHDARDPSAWQGRS